MVAPVVGSGSCPAWMARVAKPVSCGFMACVLSSNGAAGPGYPTRWGGGELRPRLDLLDRRGGSLAHRRVTVLEQPAQRGQGGPRLDAEAGQGLHRFAADEGVAGAGGEG